MRGEVLGCRGEEVSIVSIVSLHGSLGIFPLSSFLSVGFSTKTSHYSLTSSIISRQSESFKK